MKKENDQGKVDQKYGMVIDLDKCTGCGTCMVACAAENNVSVRPDQSDKERTITWMRLYKITNGKEFPDSEVSYFPRPCMQCDHHRERAFTNGDIHITMDVEVVAIVGDVIAREFRFIFPGIFHAQFTQPVFLL